MSDANPILNNPYEEPQWHYATNLSGELDYELEHGLINEDFEIPERRLDLRPFPNLFD